jgi:hypothetical protein
MQKDCGGMLVGGHRVPKCDVPEILQCIREFVVGGIARLPQSVSLGEFFRRKSSQAEKVI